ncbi:MAG TPA: adenylate/guanylate cyclase domain-containing protein [Stellaceae bacterium]|nr:adenylate/guanylate cyclase domain-containing protein [Stellaceae bacterium]
MYLQSYDGALGRKIIDLHIWAVQQGLRGASTDLLFDGLCGRLAAAGVPLWRGFAGMRTLHPQWAGYAYTWQRDRDGVEPAQIERSQAYEQDVADSPFAALIREAEGGTEPGATPRLRRRLAGPETRLDFPILERLAAAGATDYFAQLVTFAKGDPSRGQGIGFSFATDRPDGFSEDDLTLIRAVLPAASLAIMTYAGYTIASGLLAAYLGGDAGRRVHAGAVERGSVESMRAVLWYADIRSSTAIADAWEGPVIIELLDEVFEQLAAPLRSRGGQVLKFLGDGLLATFPLGEAAADEVCSRALDAAAEAMAGLDRLSAARAETGKPIAAVDLALHLGEVLYGNVGAVDRLDFTVIGPAVNEVARIETLCEPLGRKVLVFAEFAGALGDSPRLRPLGRHELRGVREPREIYALDLGA